MSDFCSERPMLERVFAQASRMDRMMQRLGIRRVDAVRAEKGMAWYEARSRCIACRYEAECNAWLDAAAAPTEAPPHCANKDFFQALIRGSACAGPGEDEPAGNGDQSSQRSRPHVANG